MKKYVKPILEIVELRLEERLASNCRYQNPPGKYVGNTAS
jgi:hypothetical protein